MSSWLWIEAVGSGTKFSYYSSVDSTIDPHSLDWLLYSLMGSVYYKYSCTPNFIIMQKIQISSFVKSLSLSLSLSHFPFLSINLSYFTNRSYLALILGFNSVIVSHKTTRISSILTPPLLPLFPTSSTHLFLHFLLIFFFLFFPPIPKGLFCKS